jgi:hypothetical protein
MGFAGLLPSKDAEQEEMSCRCKAYFQAEDAFLGAAYLAVPSMSSGFYYLEHLKIRAS